LKLVDKDGNKIIPSKPVTIAMQAPAGSKPGDEVKVDLPDGATASKRAEKLIVVVVGADGNIHVTLIPQIFKDFTVILIVIKKIVTVPVTGGAGGN
jgi:biopolymer transport protein ExbD